LKSALVDACAAYRSGLPGFLARRTIEHVTEFMGSYQDQRSFQNDVMVTLTETDITFIVRFYFGIIKPASKRFMSWAMLNLEKATDEVLSHDPPSEVEEARALRALYRFQLCCHLFGRSYQVPEPSYDGRFFHSNKISHYLSLFEPWETEEILCIHTYVIKSYGDVFLSIQWDVNARNPKFGQDGSRIPRESFDFDNPRDWNLLLEGTASFGLELLHDALMPQEHQKLVSLMQKTIGLPIALFIRSAMQVGFQRGRRRKWPSAHDQREEDRAPLPFNGDVQLDIDGSHPPLAWTKVWKNTYCNVYGDLIGDDLRMWAYVIWDVTRFEAPSLKEVLEKQIVEHFGRRGDTRNWI